MLSTLQPGSGQPSASTSTTSLASAPKRYPGYSPLLLALFFIVGCQEADSLSYRYQDYQSRLHQVLDSDARPAGPLPAIHYPDKRLRLRTIEPLEQGIIEVWDFQRCGLMALINQRNSNLGKVMPASQRYLYENHFWHKLVPCYQAREQWLDEDKEFVTRLTETYQYKQRIHPDVVHQLFFASQELAGQFSQNQKIFRPQDRPEYQGVAESLRFLAQLQAAPFSSYQEQALLEARLQRLFQQPILHSLLKSLQLSTYELNRSAEILERRLSQRPVCLNNRPTPKANILFNVLQKYYLQGIQPTIAHHSRMANQLLPPLNQIFKASTPGTALNNYQRLWLNMEDEQALWPRFQRANQRHTHAWNRLLRQCNLMPGQPDTDP